MAFTLFGASGAPGGKNLPGVGLADLGAAPGPGGSSSTSTQQSQQASEQFFQDPNLVGGVAGSAGGLAQDLAGSYKQFVTDPTSSPTFQNALSGMLAALVPGEQASRRSLADTFRAAGNLASSSFAKGAAGLESGITRNRGELASNLLSKLYPAIAQAQFAPIGQSSALINALKLSRGGGTSTGTSESQGTGPASEAANRQAIQAQQGQQYNDFLNRF